MGLIGGKASVFYQPLGVVGIVSPWNAPIALTFSPLASALAAGNSALIKPSELVPQTAELIAEMIGSAFDKTEVQAALGGADVARMFTALPFDHLIFTGGAAIARTVLAAAAPNLVPVTLELGGKAPAIVAKGSDIKYAASKIISGKFVNAGQACLAPDFVLVHRSDMTAFTEAARMAISRMYPDLSHNSDYTRVHLSNQRNRLIGLVEEAERCGAAIEVFGGETVNSLSESPRFPPVLIIDPPFHTQVMRTEIFGPVLPIVPYQTLADVVALLASLERPLALYYIGGNPSEKDYLLQNTYSGGVTFDDVMLHPFMQDLPFGGVGESGMGRYVGYDGFKALSNGKGVVQRPWIDLTRFVSPPFKPGLSRALRRVIRF
jgi:coniferyl-aldehyde dehydrogenase